MTMTDERLAELDAAASRFPVSLPWYSCTTIRNGVTGIHGEPHGEPPHQGVAYLADVFGDAATVVEVMNAYHDLRAHIDAQAATIAGLRERMLSDAAVDAGARAHMNERRRLSGVEPISDEDWHAITDDSGLRSCMDMPFRAAIVAALNAAGAA